MNKQQIMQESEQKPAKTSARARKMKASNEKTPHEPRCLFRGRAKKNKQTNKPTNRQKTNNQPSNEQTSKQQRNKNPQKPAASCVRAGKTKANNNKTPHEPRCLCRGRARKRKQRSTFVSKVMFSSKRSRQSFKSTNRHQ